MANGGRGNSRASHNWNDGTDAGRKISAFLFAIYTAEPILIINEIAEKCEAKSVGISSIYADDSANILWGIHQTEVKKGYLCSQKHINCGQIAMG